ncbi:MAG TPA: hypothetical protein VM030_09440 [Acidimicrobiales bacterium]|nr:hypothetical protein [Acidimicrobiales bacterium]
MKLRWSTLGGQVGLGVVLAGLVLVFLGWNGAASYDRVPAQFPYLISGGVAGLGLIILGAALIVVQNQRADRAALQDALAELREAVALLGTTTAAPANGAAAAAIDGDVVMAGPTSYHRPGCRLAEGRGDLPTMTVADAVASGRTPCRVCHRAPEPVRKAPRATKVSKARATKKRASR